MKPVVPKVRVGDVLCGTRNLRNYLRTCSLARYLTAVGSGMVRKEQLGRLIHAPSRNDAFVVAANAHGRFCVWSPQGDIVLIFLNTDRDAPNHPRFADTMNKKLFAQWFTRTPARWPETRKWPLYAQFLRAGLHFNAIRNQGFHIHFSPPGRASAAWDLPFDFAQRNVSNRLDQATIQQAIQEAILTGVFRNAGPRSWWAPTSAGPTLEALRDFREEVHRLSRHPRIASKLNKDHLAGLGPFLESVQAHP